MKRKKLYILITLLITVIIFSTAAICNQCSITPTTETKVTAAGQSDTTETASKTTQAQETTKETNASEGSQSSPARYYHPKHHYARPFWTDKHLTHIYPANEPNGVIFARITNNGPDTLKGSKISVTVSGSKTDISCASTQNFITQPKEYYLTLKPGETQIINLEVGIDTSKYSYNFSMTVASVDFTDPNNGNNSYSEGVASTQGSQQISKNEFPIVKGESGEIEWNAYIGSDTYCFGDNVWNNPASRFF